MNEKKIAIIGAGFSGLTLAWHLKKLGLEPEVFEAKDKVGGLIQTSQKKVMVESAAHALLNSRDVEELFSDLNIKMVRSGHVSNKKWIFRDKPRRWPLTMIETLKSVGLPKKPQAFELLSDWVQRGFSSHLNDYLASPAFQGIYGVVSSKLSASLLVQPKIRPEKGAFNGSVAPENGMSEIFQKIAEKIPVHFGSVETLESLQKKFPRVVIATDLTNCARLLQPAHSKISQALNDIPKTSLVSVTINHNNESKRVQGFGCLFPEKEKFASLGVVFNSDIFAGRGKNSETWIFSSSAIADSDHSLLQKIKEDRRRLINEELSIDESSIYRWKDTLPLYGIELEKFLTSGLLQTTNSYVTVTKNLFLTGNYLGFIGLAKILTYNKNLARHIAEVTP